MNKNKYDIFKGARYGSPRRDTKRIKARTQTKINGKVIGHIYNGRFIPLENKRILPMDFPEIAVYGSAAVANSVSEDIFRDLTEIFELRQAVSIMAIAQVRAISKFRQSTKTVSYRFTTRMRSSQKTS